MEDAVFDTLAEELSEMWTKQIPVHVIRNTAPERFRVITHFWDFWNNIESEEEIIEFATDLLIHIKPHAKWQFRKTVMVFLQRATTAIQIQDSGVNIVRLLQQTNRTWQAIMGEQTA